MKCMTGSVSELCKDQLCSKFIQVQLSRCSSTEAAVIDKFYEEICLDEENLLINYEVAMKAEFQGIQDHQLDVTGQVSLMNNVFGNYVV